MSAGSPRHLLVGVARTWAGVLLRLRETAVLVRSGVLAPTTPHKAVQELTRLRRFGPTLAGGFATAAVKQPGRVAVSDETTSRTYAELETRTIAIANGLRGYGIGPDRPLSILGRNSVAYVETLVAASRLGADVILLSTFLSPTQLHEVVERERPGIAVVDEELLHLFDAVPDGTLPIVTTRPCARWSGIEDLAADPVTHPVAATTRRGRLVVLTSGTTGTPKGARRPAPTSLSPAASMLSRLALKAGDRIMISSPLFHTWGIGVLQIAPSLAATVVLRSRSDAELVLDAVASERCTALSAVPVVLERVLQLPAATRQKYDTSSLRVVASSGAAMTREVAARFQDVFGDVLYNVYGSTEISWATIATPEDLRAVAGTAGKPPLGTRLRIVDDEGREVPQGGVGRIFVGNELLFEGYTNGSDKERRHGLVATGDKGYLDPDGRLMVVGREDDLVISGGEKIYPLEVEQVIVTMPGVKEVAVVGVPDDEMGQRLVAYVACHTDARHGAPPTADEVQGLVRETLSRFCVPRQVVFLDELPRTHTGKVVPRLLPRP